jgi:hypothetical protein
MELQERHSSRQQATQREIGIAFSSNVVVSPLLSKDVNGVISGLCITRIMHHAVDLFNF